MKTRGLILFLFSTLACARVADAVEWDWVDRCSKHLTDDARMNRDQGQAFAVGERGTPLDPSVLLDMEGSLAGEFLKGTLARVFLPQNHPELRRLNDLGRRGGGICASMCLINVVWALLRQNHHDLGEFPDPLSFTRTMLRKIDAEARSSFALDIAHGMMFREVGVLLNRRLREVGLHHDVVTAQSSALGFIRQTPAPDSIAIAQFKDTCADPHAVIIFNHDREHRRFLISDPHAPNKVLNRKYEVIPHRESYAIRLTEGLPDSQMLHDVELEYVLEICVLAR